MPFATRTDKIVSGLTCTRRYQMGRPKRTWVDKSLTKAWFNTVATALGDSSPRRLEKHFQPELLKRNEIGKLNDSRGWDKYRAGEKTPSDRRRKDGSPLAVLSAAGIPGALDIYYHPIWKVLRHQSLPFDLVIEIIESFSHFVKRNYFDLRFTNDSERKYESFIDSIGSEIWIDTDDDYLCSLDHLTAQISILRMDKFRHHRTHRAMIAKNIVKCLGPIAASSAFNTFYEEFFDNLETHCWGDIFDHHYDRGSSSISGWRRSRGQWI